jgi:hypothetical protein
MPAVSFLPGLCSMSARRGGRSSHRYYGVLSFTLAATVALVLITGVLVFVGALR